MEQNGGGDKRRLYKWQSELPGKFLAANGKGIAKAVPGAGKTKAAINVIKQMQPCRVDIVVPSRVLKAQWERELIVAEVSGANIHMIRSGAKRVVDTDLMIIDECHRSVSPKHRGIYKWTRKWTLGLSATPHPENETLIGPVIVEVGFDEANVTDFNVVFHGVELNGDEFESYEKLTEKIRRVSWHKSRTPEDERLKEAILARLIYRRRNIVYLADTRVPYTAELIRTMRNKHKKILIMGTRIKQAHAIAEVLREQHPETSVFGYWCGHSSDEDLAAFKQAKDGIMVSVGMLKEGWDCPDLAAGVFISTQITEATYIQKVGRYIRAFPGKRSADIHVLVAGGTTDEKVLNYKNYGNHELVGL